MSPSDGSVSHWLRPLQAGDPDAVHQLWERYFQRLIELARKRLRDLPHREAAEDVALSAFDSFCRGAGRGRFPQLADRDSLWRLLVVITARKAAHYRRDANRQKRGAGAVGVGSAPPDADMEAYLEQIVGREPTPEFAAQAAEECRHLLGRLGDPELESIARLRMEGYTLEEIADQLGYVPRTIKRKLRLIRNLWQQELAP
jgi:RNA polymerase sigma factor (sigma-70 family)